MEDSDHQPTLARAPFCINGALVEPGALRICGRQAECRIEPKVMALLVALAERPGQLWTREQLIARIWAGAAASDESLTRIVYQLRRALKRAAVAAGAVRTVSKHGYRLDAEIRAADQAGATSPPNSTRFPAFSVAVLPVVDMTPGGEGKLLADGLTRDLTMLLSRTPQYRVTPYSSAVRLSADTVDLVAAGEALHARFIVTTTLVRSGDTVRVRADLGDAAENVLLWAEKYETAVDRFFEVQEDVVFSITTAITAKVNTTQPVRVRRTGRFSLSAYERVLAAEALRANYGTESARQIVAMLQEALEIEPDDPITRAALAVQLSQNVVSQWAEDPAATVAQADALIAQALEAAPSDPEVRADAGVVATMFHRPDEAIRHLELATARNPNNAHALAVLGWQHCLRHADPAGIGLIETAEARAPHHPRFGLWATYRATGHLFMLDHDRGLRGGQRAVERTPNYYQPHLTCAWAHAGLGDSDSARREIRRAQALDAQDILEKFVEEMRKWSQNSPNRAQCWEVLEALRSLGEKSA
ncbi:MAG: winged helix-turn-helix domain-containing protein [Rhodanobacteraceae bacterium]